VNWKKNNTGGDVAYPKIIDVSSNNHPATKPITWRAVKAAGIAGVIIKASQGTTYANPWFARDLAGATNAGLPVLAYHFAAWGQPAAEAAYFEGVAGKGVAAVLDIETSTNVDWANAFLSVLNRGFTKQMVYGSASSLSGIYGNLHGTIWVAAYQSDQPKFGTLWQYTSTATVPGVPNECDVSYWVGSLSGFNTMFQITTYTKGREMIASTTTGNGYWCVKSTGAVYAYGAAKYEGGANAGADPHNPGKSDLGANDAIVGIAGKANDGYWLYSNTGAVFAYGSATYHGGPNQA
jgi:GH25 family lysozyme M1 (1,4-beta-N-acetylmuramidase)